MTRNYGGLPVYSLLSGNGDRDGFARDWLHSHLKSLDKFEFLSAPTGLMSPPCHCFGLNPHALRAPRAGRVDPISKDRCCQTGGALRR